MKKSYFMKTFNLNLSFFILWFFLSFMNVAFNLLTPSISNLGKIEPFTKIPFLFSRVYHFSVLVWYVLIFWLVLSIAKEFISRVLNDSLSNYVKSIVNTFGIRRFLSQRERVEIKSDSQEKTTVNPILKDFNRAAGKAVVDIRKERVVVYLKLPHSQQAQKIMKDLENQLKEEISNRNPNYFFSSPNRVKNKLWLIGTKR